MFGTRHSGWLLVAVGFLPGLGAACGVSVSDESIGSAQVALASATPRLRFEGGDDTVPADPAVAKPGVRRLAPAGAPLGVRRVAALMVYFQPPPADLTAAVLAADAFTSPTSGSALLAESSYGKLTLTGDMFGWYSIPEPGPNCDLAGISASARGAAAAAGVNLDGYDHLAYVTYPYLPGCGAAGVGEVGPPATPGRQTWYQGRWSPFVFAHEIGHNLGFLHASSYTCGSSVLAASNQCASSEYGDPYDVMGSGLAHVNAYNKATQGWLDVCQIATASGRAVFDVLPVETSTSGVHGVRVPVDPSLCPPEISPPCYYALEYRQPIGLFDGGPDFVGSPMFQGALVRLVGSLDVSGATLLQRTELLDLVPGGNVLDGRLEAGRSFQDPFGVRFAVQSANATSAKVAVEIPNGSGPARCLDGTALATNTLCADGVRDGGETDVDCGGPCAPCGDGRACSQALDCWNRSCLAGICQTSIPTCTDGVKDGVETDVDCGGSNSCSRCGDGLVCKAGSDCRSGRCENGLCMNAQLRAVVRVYSDWASGFCGDITLTNTGTTRILDWKVKVRFPASRFTSTWNATYTPGADSIVDVTPLDWNRAISPQSNANMGFCAQKTGASYRPQLVTVIATP